MIRIGLVEDLPLLRRSFKAWLHEHADLVVVAEAGSTAEAIVIATTIPMDVLILDLCIPDAVGLLSRMDGGLDVLRQIANKVSVIVLTNDSDTRTGILCSDLGAQGYVRKMSEPVEIVHAIREVFAGRSSFPPDVMRARQ